MRHARFVAWKTDGSGTDFLSRRPFGWSLHLRRMVEQNLLTTSERGGKLLCEIKMVIPLYHAGGRQGCVRRHTGAGKTTLLISSYFWRHHA